MATEIIGQIVQGLMYMIYLCAFCGFIFYVAFLRQFKHKLIERHQTQHGDLIKIIRCREFMDKNHVTRWQKLKRFEKIACPPSNCISLDYRGKKVVEVAVSSEGNYHYVEIDTRRQGGAVTGLSTEDRLSHLYNIEKANSYKKKTLGEMVMILAPLGMMTVVCVLLMIFWGDIAQPVLEAQSLQLDYEIQQTEQLQLLRDIKMNVQSIQGSTTQPAPGEGSP